MNFLDFELSEECIGFKTKYYMVLSVLFLSLFMFTFSGNVMLQKFQENHSIHFKLNTNGRVKMQF